MTFTKRMGNPEQDRHQALSLQHFPIRLEKFNRMDGPSLPFSIGNSSGAVDTKTGEFITMQIEPTPYADINAMLEELLSGSQKILGNRLVGYYLYGSLVTGDFDFGSSDLDLLAATLSDIDEQEFGSLHAMHNDFAHKYKAWDGRIEVAYLSTDALKTFRSHTSKIAVISPGEPFHIKDAGKDWLMNWYIVREKGMTLYGPPPETVIDPISKAELLAAVQEHGQEWREWIYHARHRNSQAYAILTMCRILYTLKNGEIVSKKRAALWAEKELPEWSALIQQALVWRESWRDENIDHEATFPVTLRFVQFVTGQCL